MGWLAGLLYLPTIYITNQSHILATGLAWPTGGGAGQDWEGLAQDWAGLAQDDQRLCSFELDTLPFLDAVDTTIRRKANPV